MKLGMPGYTVCWTFCFWFGGLPWAAIPAFIIAYPIACWVQSVVDGVRRWADGQNGRTTEG